MALTDTQLRNAKPEAKDYTIADGLGLSIFISSKGGKWWRFRYRHLDKSKLMSMGTYPEFTLQQARTKRDAARAMVAKNIEPAQSRIEQKQKARIDAINTFETIGNEWHALHNKNKSERHPSGLPASLSTPATGAIRLQKDFSSAPASGEHIYLSSSPAHSVGEISKAVH